MLKLPKLLKVVKKRKSLILNRLNEHQLTCSLHVLSVTLSRQHEPPDIPNCLDALDAIEAMEAIEAIEPSKPSKPSQSSKPWKSSESSNHRTHRSHLGHRSQGYQRSHRSHRNRRMPSLASDSRIVMADGTFFGDSFKQDRSWDDSGTTISWI